MKIRNIVLAFLSVLSISSCGNGLPGSVGKYNCTGPIYPDYVDVTVPATIAPLNFSYLGEVPSGSKTVFSAAGISLTARGRRVRLDGKAWHRLLSAARGGDIAVRSEALDTTWFIHVSDDEIDYGLNYRLIEPSYEKYSGMGIYERELSSYDQVPLIKNTEFGGCCNCHSHCAGDPSVMSMHIRGDKACTLILRDGELKAFNSRTDSTASSCVYTYWHPSGKYIAYSSNVSFQNFNIGAEKVLEVIDGVGDVLVYDVDDNKLILSPELTRAAFVESFPSFSPDGGTLYFTRYRLSDASNNFRKVQYELCRISFDPEKGAMGDSVAVLIDSTAIGGGSVCFPKPSPDGRYVMFSRADYGIFASWHHESDMWLYDVLTGESRPLDEINSRDSEGCHCWSSNGRWFVFGSRRDDGLFTRLYIAHFDPQTGRCGKPFMLPQENPAEYYGTLFFSYNIPEFVKGPKEFDHIAARRLINSGEREQFGIRRQGSLAEFDAVSGSSRNNFASASE